MICDVWFETLNSQAGSYVLLSSSCWLVLHPHGCVPCVCLRRSSPFKENRVGRCSSPASHRPRHWASANVSPRWKPCWQIACPNLHASTVICLAAKPASPTAPFSCHHTPSISSRLSLVRWKRQQEICSRVPSITSNPVVEKAGWGLLRYSDGSGLPQRGSSQD